MSTPTRMWTPEQLADVMHTPPQTIRKWCRQDRIHAKKFGRIWRVADREVQRVLEAGIR